MVERKKESDGRWDNLTQSIGNLFLTDKPAARFCSVSLFGCDTQSFGFNKKTVINDYRL